MGKIFKMIVMCFSFFNLVVVSSANNMEQIKNSYIVDCSSEESSNARKKNEGLVEDGGREDGKPFVIEKNKIV